MAQVDVTKLTAPNGAATYNEIIYKELMSSTSLNQLFNILEGQMDGKKVAILGGFGMLGVKSEGCNPTYENSLMDTQEKEWDIEEWQIAESICYDKLKGTMIQYAMNNGIEVANLVDTDYFESILKPALEEAIKRMMIRLAFFGNKTITEGELNDVDVKFFNVIDGIWKQVFDGVAASAISRTAIDANAKTTMAAQEEAISGAGVATKLLRKVIQSAPMELRTAGNRVLYITQSLYDAWTNDVQDNNKGSEGQWDSLEDGLLVGKINGVDTVVVPDWDVIIKGSLKNTTNAEAYDKPYRAILTTRDNLLLGTESNGNFEALDYGFDRKSQDNWILAKNTIGAMVRFDKLIHVAF